MQNKLKLKNSREFLKKDFPENILPSKKLLNKDILIIQEKSFVLKKYKKKIQKLKKYLELKAKKENTTKIFLPSNNLLINYYKKERKPSFLFSYNQIKNDLLRIQEYTRPSSYFLSKIKEKKKFSLLYGNISKKFYQKAFIQAEKERGRINEKLIYQFERRLDVLLYRLYFTKTIGAARQYISHNLVLINGVKVNIPSYQAKAGDIISIDQKGKKQLSTFMVEDLKKKKNPRRFRFIISIKYLEKFLNNEISKIISSVKWNKKLLNPKIKILYQGIKKLTIKIKKILYTKRKYNKKKRTWFFRKKRSWVLKKKQTWLLAGLLRLNNLLIILKKTMFFFYSWNKKKSSNILLRKRKQKFIFLIFKRIMYRRSSRYDSLVKKQTSPFKPLHLESSYKIMRGILLYPPQKIIYPALLNIDLISRLLAKN